MVVSSVTPLDAWRAACSTRSDPWRALRLDGGEEDASPPRWSGWSSTEGPSRPSRRGGRAGWRRRRRPGSCWAARRRATRRCGGCSPSTPRASRPCGRRPAVPAAAIAAAAWSWVEKMLQLAQRTSAPRACSVSISTAVWMVMCSEPAMRAPLSGWLAAYSSRMAMRPGISVSAIWISLRPQSGEAQIGDGVVLGAGRLSSGAHLAPSLWYGSLRAPLPTADPRGRPLRAWREGLPSQRSSKLCTGHDYT